MKRTPIWLLLLIGAIGNLPAQAPADSLHIAHYTILLDLTQYQTQQLYGTAILKAVPNHPLPALTLELMQLQADSVSVGGNKMRFSQEGGLLRIPADSKNAFLFGLSKERLLMLMVFTIIFIINLYFFFVIFIIIIFIIVIFFFFLFLF